MATIRSGMRRMFKVWLSTIFLPTCCGFPLIGLTRARDTLLAEQRELHQQRARGKSDESLISEISRLESLMTVAKDDLVCSFILTRTQLRISFVWLTTESLQTPYHGHQG
jgi:hypothetical protein